MDAGRLLHLHLLLADVTRHILLPLRLLVAEITASSIIFQLHLVWCVGGFSGTHLFCTQEECLTNPIQWVQSEWPASKDILPNLGSSCLD